MFRLQLLAIGLCVACNTPAQVPERKTAVDVAPIPPPPANTAVPVATAMPKIDGHILGVTAEQGHGDAVLLATVSSGQPLVADRSTCGPVREGAQFDQLDRGSVSGTFALVDVFNNEANRCIGHFSTDSKSARSHSVATSGLRLLPTSPMVDDAVRLATIEDVKPRLRATATRHNIHVGSTSLTYSPRRFPSAAEQQREWAVTTQLAAPGTFHPCTPQFPFAAGLSLYQVVDGQPQMVFDHVDVPDANHYEGAYTFVDFLWIDGMTQPWVVLHRNACECQSFVLLAPRQGATSSVEWAMIEGAHSCTI